MTAGLTPSRVDRRHFEPYDRPTSTRDPAAVGDAEATRPFTPNEATGDKGCLSLAASRSE